jgi:predicted enzyme related to lactoylglutathione lyase
MTTPSTVTPESVAAQGALKGRFVWYDLITNDIPAAIAFYSKVAGWGTQEYDMGPGGQLTMWTANDAPIGDVVALTPDVAPPGTPPYWFSHVAVPDVDATAREVTALGGTVLKEPTDIPTVGRYAVIADPQGAAIAIFTSLSPTFTAYAPRVGEFSWHELVTTDHRGAIEFYGKIFGWVTVSEEDVGPPVEKYLIFGPPGAAPGHSTNPPYGGMFTKTPDMPMPPAWLYYIRVRSADETAELVKSLGGQVIFGPMEVPGGDRIAQCIDPQGAVFAVHSVKEG